MVLGRASVTSPSTSILSSLLAILQTSRESAHCASCLLRKRSKMMRTGSADRSWYQDPCGFRQDPGALRGDRDGVLEVGRERPVDGRDRPVVVVHVDLRL